MPETLYEFCQADWIKKPKGGKNIAGFIENNRFKYFESDNPMLPAIINALEESKEKIYTNSEKGSWVRAYPGMDTKIKLMKNLKPAEGDGAKIVTAECLLAKKWPRQLSALALNAPLPEGGLYAVASSLKRNLDLPEDSRKRGLARAVRYYMLATYALVDISGAESYEGLNNYVGALLVSDNGKILAAGINTGSFRHAEANMLLSYFRSNPSAKKIPEKSVIFSTLTPCQGCTGYLTMARCTQCKIYFGQEDPGDFGRVGKTISTRLSTVTKEPQGRIKKDLPGAAEPGDVGGEGVVSHVSAHGVHKTKIDNALTSCMEAGSVAKQIGKAGKSREVLSSASEALIQKMLKTRSSGDPESTVKAAVLQHIGQWLGTSKIID